MKYPVPIIEIGIQFNSVACLNGGSIKIKTIGRDMD